MLKDISDNRYKNIKTVTKPSACIYCGCCPHEVKEFYDENKDLQPSDFIGKKLICENCSRRITKEYNKKKKELICSKDYYFDLHYGIELEKQKSLVDQCDHVEDKELLRKQLGVIYEDFDSLVAKREGKEK